MIVLQKILEEALVNSKEFNRILQGTIDMRHHSETIVKEMMESPAMVRLVKILERVYKGEKDEVKPNH